MAQRSDSTSEAGDRYLTHTITVVPNAKIEPVATTETARLRIASISLGLYSTLTPVPATPGTITRKSFHQIEYCVITPTPPDISFPKTLPTHCEKSWGAYMLTLVKSGLEPQIYLGSGASIRWGLLALLRQLWLLLSQ